MLNVQGVYKLIDDETILRNISFTIEPGSIFGIIGPNGSGKSTLLRCIAGIYKMDAGIIEFDEQPIFDNAFMKEKIGYVADYNHFYSTYTVQAMINLFHDCYPTFDMDKFCEINALFHINKRMLITKLSKGMRTKLSLMLALSIHPRLLILDEPTSGLDPASRRVVLDMLLSEVCEHQVSILIASHNLTEVERICDAIGILKNGTLKYSNTLDNMKENIRKYQFVLTKPTLIDFSTMEGVIHYTHKGRVHYIVTRDKNKFLEEIAKVETHFIEEIDLSLEDMFIYSTGGIDYAE